MVLHASVICMQQLNVLVTLPCAFNSGSINDCGAHLINQGVSVSGNSATVEWQGTGPDPDNRVQDFQCSLDGGASSSCKFIFCTSTRELHNKLYLVQPDHRKRICS